MTMNVNETGSHGSKAATYGAGMAHPLPETGSDAARLRRLALWALALWTVLRLTLAWFGPLGVDENYAIAAAREFSWSFYDHPPLGFWLPVAMARITGIEHPFVFRLPFLLFGTGTAWLLWLIGNRLGGARVGLWALLFFILSPVLSISWALLIVPDGPLGFFLMLTVLLLMQIETSERAGQPVAGLWLAAGAALGGAMLSKYQAGLVPVSLLLYMLLTRHGRGWLRQPWPWIGALVALWGLLPVLIWNLQHDWASFAFHTGRAGGGISLVNFARMLAGQVIYLVPTIAIATAIGIWAGLRGRMGEAGRMLAFLALGPIVMFNIIYLMTPGGGTLPHWALPGWVVALPLGALVLTRAPGRWQLWGKRLTVFIVAVMWLMLIVLTVHVRTGIITRSHGENPPDWDRTVDAFDWSGLVPALEKRGLLDDVDAIAVIGWSEGGAMSTALHDRLPVYPLSPNDHHFLFHRRSAKGGKALLLVPARPQTYEKKLANALKLAHRYDPQAEVLAPVILPRGGIPYARVIVIRLTLPPRKPGTLPPK